MYITPHQATAVQPLVQPQTVHLVEGDTGIRLPIADFLRDNGFNVAEYDDLDELQADQAAALEGCIVISAELAALELGEGFPARTLPLPAVHISQIDDVRTSVRAMKSGAVDFIAKPFEEDALVRAVLSALALADLQRAKRSMRQSAVLCFSKLTPRERQVCEAVTRGLMNKQIAYELSISEIMVKIHRGRVMRKMQSKTLPDLVRKFDMLDARSDGTSRPMDLPNLN